MTVRCGSTVFYFFFYNLLVRVDGICGSITMYFNIFEYLFHVPLGPRSWNCVSGGLFRETVCSFMCKCGFSFFLYYDGCVFERFRKVIIRLVRVYLPSIVCESYLYNCAGSMTSTLCFLILYEYIFAIHYMTLNNTTSWYQDCSASSKTANSTRAQLNTFITLISVYEMTAQITPLPPQYLNWKLPT